MRILFKRDLSRIASAKRKHPEVPVAAAVRQIDHRMVGRIQSWRLHLSGLLRHAKAAANIFQRFSVNRKFPDVKLNMLAADSDQAVLIDVGASRCRLTARK